MNPVFTAWSFSLARPNADENAIDVLSPRCESPREARGAATRGARDRPAGTKPWAPAARSKIRSFTIVRYGKEAARRELGRNVDKFAKAVLVLV